MNCLAGQVSNRVDCPETLLARTYEDATAKSKALYERARKVFAGGVNHNARDYEPYPLFVKKSLGKSIWDEDGNRYTDYWMGHMALILGHSPKVVADAVAEQAGNGTLFGMGSSLSVELGEEISRDVPCAEMMRFCNTGAEATMYLVRLARGFTRKRTIVKMAGGWHGYNTDLNKGVKAPFDRVEGAGILPEEQAHVANARFNDLESVRAAVKKAEGDVAAIFLEPVLGAGGCIPAKKDFLKGVRELADSHGALLAFDEIITGFRVALGGAQSWYGVTPDIATFGKVAGGGLPLGLVAGRREIVSMADPRRKEGLVSIGGGTFSENPLTMAAGLATLRYLRRNQGTIYPRLTGLGARLRKDVDKALREGGLEANTTGLGSLFLTHFGARPSNAQDSGAEDRSAVKAYALHLMENGIFVLPGHAGGVSTLHTAQDVRKLADEGKKFAEVFVSQKGIRRSRRPSTGVRQHRTS